MHSIMVLFSFDPIKKKHKVCYDDGDVEILNFKKEKWELIKDESQEVAADHPSLDGASEMSRKKKTKSADQPIKNAKIDASPKRGRGASSGKSKGATTKPGNKIKEDGKVDGSKSVGKSDNVTKAKGHTPKSGNRPVGVAPKVGSKSKTEDSVDTPKDDDNVTPEATAIIKSTKSKDDDNVTPKAATKPKQDATKTAKSKHETPKVSANSKGKPLKSGGKSDANGGGKSKSGSSKVKGSEGMKESSADSTEVVETFKRKTPSSPNGEGNDPTSTKKRREEPKAALTAES